MRSNGWKSQQGKPDLSIGERIAREVVACLEQKCREMWVCCPWGNEYISRREPRQPKLTWPCCEMLEAQAPCSTSCLSLAVGPGLGGPDYQCGVELLSDSPKAQSWMLGCSGGGGGGGCS